MRALLLSSRKTWSDFTPDRNWLRLPLRLALTLAFVWVAEAVATFVGAWKHLNQRLGWQRIGVDKKG